MYSDYHEQLATLLAVRLKDSDAKPVSLLEIGSALGRGFYETVLRVPTLKHAVLVEPSENLSGLFNTIFYGPENSAAPFDTAPVRKAVEEVDIRLLQKPFAELGGDLGVFDLVVCSNVIDQCVDPLKLVGLLKTSCDAGGTLVLSCTYQWQQKYLGNASPRIENINSLFTDGWRRLTDANIPFHVRAFERHWLSFLSHAVIFQKL